MRMKKQTVTAVAKGEFSSMITPPPHREIRTLRRPEPVDEADRLGRELVRRMMEAGVTEPR
jgi:hypothetical protein